MVVIYKVEGLVVYLCRLCGGCDGGSGCDKLVLSS